MARIKDRQKVILLRKSGKTYGEIKRELGISKSTLSNWLSKYPLSEKELFAVKESVDRNKDIAVERCRLTKQKKREKRILGVYNSEKKKHLPLSSKEIYVAGLFLYWGEGSKNIKGSVSLSNTDPEVLKFYLFWLRNSFKIPTEKIKVLVHLYKDMEIERELAYWSKELKISRTQFSKPYIKKSSRSDIDQKGFGHGTCNLIVCDIRLKEKIMMGIKAIADYYLKNPRICYNKHINKGQRLNSRAVSL
jgi:hypothetical protein